MSRIAGVVAPGTGGITSDVVSRMLAVAMPPGVTWQSASRQSGHAMLGWTGWKTADVALAPDGVIAAADGYVYNPEEVDAPSGATTAAVVAALYRRHGFEETLRRLNGDFAVALYDPAGDVLWLGTDRLATRPLYYTESNGSFVFASQPRSLLTAPGVSREPNREFVALFAGSHYRVVDNDLPASPYAAIRRLPAAHVLRVFGGSAKATCYWKLEDLPDHVGTERDLAERYRELLFDAVRRRFKAARRPAFTLSGGMDSSSVLATAVKLSNARQPAVSVGYVDRTYDESDEIQPMLAPTVSQWHKLTVDIPDVFGLVERMVAIHDEPVVTATWLSHYLMCGDAATRGYGSLFGGLGGDELNAGEYEHFWYFFADLKMNGGRQLLDHEVRMWAHHHDHPIFRKSPEIMERNLGRLADLSTPGRCRPDRQRIERYAAALSPGFFDLKSYTPVMEHPFKSYLKNRTYQDMTRETIPCCLRAEDRHTVAFGMDNFVPFFDHRLIEFMFRIPGTLKFRDGVTKHLLRQAMDGVLPEETRTRPKKSGWNAPAHVWFTTGAREPLRDLVASRGFRERGVYNVGEVQRLIDEHERIVSEGSAVDNHMMFFWQLVNVDLWLQGLTG